MIVGGMCFGTLLTLFVVPTMYTLVRQWLGQAVWARIVKTGVGRRASGKARRRVTAGSARRLMRLVVLDTETTGSRGQGRSPHHRGRCNRDRRPPHHRAQLPPLRESRARQRRRRARGARPPRISCATSRSSRTSPTTCWRSSRTPRVIIHNAAFDLEFLDAELERLGRRCSPSTVSR